MQFKNSLKVMVQLQMVINFLLSTSAIKWLNLVLVFKIVSNKSILTLELL